jgi:hypothetical protein
MVIQRSSIKDLIEVATSLLSEKDYRAAYIVLDELAQRKKPSWVEVRKAIVYAKRGHWQAAARKLAALMEVPER